MSILVREREKKSLEKGTVGLEMRSLAQQEWRDQHNLREGRSSCSTNSENSGRAKSCSPSRSYHSCYWKSLKSDRVIFMF